MAELAFQVAHADLYLPSYEAATDEAPYLPSATLPGWERKRHGEWTSWSPAGFDPGRLIGSGWKIHVSSTYDAAQATLDSTAQACRDHGVAFKHLADPLQFLLLHHKHGPRVQSGKFCTLYPVDVDQARAVMERMAEDLATRTGPYVLTDRRYAPNSVISYRYGARVGTGRVELDGTTTQLTIDEHGEQVPDAREPRFHLPKGVADPFARPEAASEADDDGLLNGRYRVLSVVQHSNAGGAYIALDATSGQKVLLKEARRHNGLHPDGTDACARLAHEYRMLRTIHAADPGLCPEPIEHFTVWENDFLAMELVPGVPLVSWYSHNGVLQRLDASPAECADYLDKVQLILTSIRGNLDRLHALGIGFGDVSHGNILVGADDRTTRLIDFESSGTLTTLATSPGTPWFRAPGGTAETLASHDDYGYSTCAQLLLFPLMGPLDRDPAGRLPLLRRDLEAVIPVPEGLWREATRFLAQVPTHNPLLPSCSELDETPSDALCRMTGMLRDGLLSMARPDRDDWMFPLHPDGYRRGSLGRAYGAAGVLDALRQVDTPEDQLAQYWDRLELETVAALGDAPAPLPPGLRSGLAGIAWALADAGRTEAAAGLMQRVHEHPLTRQLRRIAADRGRPVEQRFTAWADLGDGLAGIGMAQLGVCRADPSADSGAAVEIGDLLCAQVDRLAAARRTPGLTCGLSGLALFLLSLADTTGKMRYRDVANALLTAELALGTVDPDGTIRFHDLGGRRTIAYLGSGSAGVACALSRAVAQGGDPALSDALPHVLDGMRMHLSVQPGLDAGVGSWVYAFVEHSRWAGTDDDLHTAQRIATSITKHLVPWGAGLVPLGSLDARLHADLTSGAAGVLLALAKSTSHPEARAWTVD